MIVLCRVFRISGNKDNNKDSFILGSFEVQLQNNSRTLTLENPVVEQFLVAAAPASNKITHQQTEQIKARNLVNPSVLQNLKNPKFLKSVSHYSPNELFRVKNAQKLFFLSLTAVVAAKSFSDTFYKSIAA